MLGVMDGAASDLRTGLPWQGVDIHEPMRLLFIVETTPEAMLSIMEPNATIDRICRGGWVQLAVLDPHSSDIMYFSGGRFVKHIPQNHELPIVQRSTDWSRGSRDNLPFAIVESVSAVAGKVQGDCRRLSCKSGAYCDARSNRVVCLDFYELY